MNAEISWLDEPEEHDYPAAESYLSLIYDPEKVEYLIGELRKAPVSRFKAILLCGGDKSTQQADIRLAKEYWSDWKRRNR